MNQHSNFRIIAVVVATTLFMQNIDSTAIATALPAMARDLNVNAVHLSAAITSYLVAMTVFIPVSGWVADRFGAKRIFMWAIFLFTAASCSCALSNGLGELIIARIVQGASGAMMVPVGRLVLLRGVRREDLLSATTWLSMPAMVGPVIGPPLGGFLTDTFSWRSIFWINLPMGILGLLLVWRLIPKSENERPPKLDIIGMTLMGTAISVFMMGVETVGRGIVAPQIPWLAIAAGLVLFWLTVRHCKRVPNPATDFSLLSIPTFKAATAAGSLFRAGAGALPFMVPLTLQLGFGLSASRSGMLTLASAVGAFCMRPMAQFFLQRFRVRSILLGGCYTFAATLLVCATLTADWPEIAIFLVLVCAGLARSLNFACMNALTYADVPPQQLSAATSFSGTAQQLPRAAGVAVAAGVMQLSMMFSGRETAAHWDFAWSFIAIAAVVLAAAPGYAALAPEAGAGISRGRRSHKAA
ncbi:MAG TPA: DHA2 family efflux MFS transporter permease subunit [Bordetella sp.]|nr:DHA2 family efflux MFS transporter permease subunit [Bordetella sp.]